MNKQLSRFWGGSVLPLPSLLTAVFLAPFAPASHAQFYAVVPLQQIYGPLPTTAMAINNAGQIAGFSITADGNSHAILWSHKGQATDLGTLGGQYSEALGMNDAGQIVGVSSTAVRDLHAVVWNFLAASDLGGSPSSFNGANAVNDAGTIVGQSSFPEPLATVFTGNSTVVLPQNLSDGESGANGINDGGEVVGWAQTTAASIHAVTWSDSTGKAFAVDLGTLGGGSSTANSINNSGAIVGWSDTVDGHRHATIWHQSAITDLGTLGGSDSIARSVNSHGIVVGSAFPTGNASYHATMWKNGKAIDIETRLTAADAQAYELSEAVAINDRCWIAANGITKKNGTYTSFLLVPLRHSRCNPCPSQREDRRNYSDDEPFDPRSFKCGRHREAGEP